MNEDIIISKRRTQKITSETLRETQDDNLDTVALMCIAVVSKSEYDELKVDNISPIEVNGVKDKVVINPFLIIGSSDHTRTEALNRVNKVWDIFDKRLEETEEYE